MRSNHIISVALGILLIAAAHAFALMGPFK